MEYRRHQISNSLQLRDLQGTVIKYDYHFHGISKLIEINSEEDSSYPFALSGIVLPNGNIAINEGDEILILKRDTLIATLSGHTDLITQLKVLSTGDIVSKSNDNSIRLWNGVTFECYDILIHSSQINDFVIMPDDTIISASDDDLTHWVSSTHFSLISRDGSIQCIIKE